MSSFIRYTFHPVIKLFSPSKCKSFKLAFGGLLSYIQVSNDHLIKLTYNISTILLVKQSICRFVNNIYSYSTVKS